MVAPKVLHWEWGVGEGQELHSEQMTTQKVPGMEDWSGPGTARNQPRALCKGSEEGGFGGPREPSRATEPLSLAQGPALLLQPGCQARAPKQGWSCHLHSGDCLQPPTPPCDKLLCSGGSPCCSDYSRQHPTLDSALCKKRAGRFLPPCTDEAVAWPGTPESLRSLC